MHSKRLFSLLLILASLVWSRALHAHPMGNFSVNHYSKITLGSNGVTVQYFIDLAEIPAYQELQGGSLAADSQAPAVRRFVAVRGADFAHGLSLSVNGTPLPLHLTSSGVIFPPGAGGLPTMKMGFVYQAAYPIGISREHVTLHYADVNYPGHTGWKEIIALDPGGSLLSSSVPGNDRSAELSNYPTDLLTSPPQDLEASLEAALPPQGVAAQNAPPKPVAAHTAAALATKNAPSLPSSRSSQPHGIPALPTVSKSARLTGAPQPPPSLHLQANQQKTPRNRFTELITTQHLSLWFLLTAAFIAMGLGGLHALEPGHGKTIVAAYLVGSKGTARHAAMLGIIVTASHTIGVFALGAITLYASRYIVPEQLYPWLGVLSGFTIAVLGGYLLLRRLTGTATDHSHLAGETGGHWFFFKRQDTSSAAADQSQRLEPTVRAVSLTQLFTLGVTGGIIPCPAALIVLLSAFALHRIALGFFLIVAFSFGLAAVLIAFGTLMVYARRFMTHLQIDGPLTRRWLPVASSSFIMILGSVVAFQAAAGIHFSGHLLTKDRLGPALFLAGLGLVLGMRHSTDADHVVAISTIVSKQRSVRNAAFIGSVWGLGHTITIFIVGALIILFGVEIPPRVGLSMEFCVALMLIVLGVLNLTGVMQKVTSHFTALRAPQAEILVSSPREKRWMASRLFEGSVGRFGAYQFLRPLVIGLVHGLAGSAAVALLVLSTIHNPVWATVYLLIFGFGTMVGMMCMTTAIAVPLTYAGDRFTKVSRFFGVASGLVSLSFGSFLVYQLGYLGGLFTSHPEWTPR